MPSEIAFGFFRIGSEWFLKFGSDSDWIISDRIRILKFTNYRIGNFQSDPMHTFNSKHVRVFVSELHLTLKRLDKDVTGGIPVV